MSLIEDQERSTYLPSGVRETLRSNADVAAVQVEPIGFTGKVADDEVGLTYFGHRYLTPHLGRWASPDPLQGHQGGGGDFGNSYHYVSGSLLQAMDPAGLDAQTIVRNIIRRSASRILQNLSGDQVQRIVRNRPPDDEVQSPYALTQAREGILVDL